MRLLLLALLLILTLPHQTNDVDTSKMGVHLLLDDGRNHWDAALWDEHLRYADQMVPEGGFVVQVIRSDDLDTAKWQYFMDLCTTYHLTPVLRLATTFDRENGYWRIPDPGLSQVYADFIEGLRWPEDNKYIIILNEPNNAVEWAGQPDPAAYAHFFAETAQLFKEQISDVVILNAALDLYAPDTGGEPFPGTDWRYINASRFMDEMVAAQPGIFDYVDVWNSHAYPLGAFRQPPWEQQYHFDVMNDAPPVTQHPPEGVYNRGINGYVWELWKLSTFGVGALPVFISETGWRHTSDNPDSLDAGEGYPTPEQAADYMHWALYGHPDHDTYQPWLTDNRVIGVAFFALNGIPTEWAHTNLLDMSVDGTVMGTTALFDYAASIQP